MHIEYRPYIVFDSPEEAKQRETLKQEIDEWFSLHPLTKEQMDLFLKDACIDSGPIEVFPSNPK